MRRSTKNSEPMSLYKEISLPPVDDTTGISMSFINSLGKQGLLPWVIETCTEGNYDYNDLINLARSCKAIYHIIFSNTTLWASAALRIDPILYNQFYSLLRIVGSPARLLRGMELMVSIQNEDERQERAKQEGVPALKWGPNTEYDGSRRQNIVIGNNFLCSRESLDEHAPVLRLNSNKGIVNMTCLQLDDGRFNEELRNDGWVFAISVWMGDVSYENRKNERIIFKCDEETVPTNWFTYPDGVVIFALHFTDIRDNEYFKFFAFTVQSGFKRLSYLEDAIEREYSSVGIDSLSDDYCDLVFSEMGFPLIYSLPNGVTQRSICWSYNDPELDQVFTLEICVHTGRLVSKKKGHPNPTYWYRALIY